MNKEDELRTAISDLVEGWAGMIEACMAGEGRGTAANKMDSACLRAVKAAGIEAILAKPVESRPPFLRDK